jgi:hypothetical protein
MLPLTWKLRERQQIPIRDESKKGNGKKGNDGKGKG